MSDFAKRLADEMKKKGLSQASLGRLAGIKRQTINAWLRGRKGEIEGDNLVQVANALGVTGEWLRTGKTAPPLPAIALADPPKDLVELTAAWEYLLANQRAEFLQAIVALAATNRATLEELSSKIRVRDTQMADDYIGTLTQRPVTSPSDKEVAQKLFRHRRKKHA